MGQPSDTAVSRIVALLESARTSLTADVAQATVLATRPLGPLLAEMDVTDAAAWTVAGNVLMNLDEFPAKR